MLSCSGSSVMIGPEFRLWSGGLRGRLFKIYVIIIAPTMISARPPMVPPTIEGTSEDEDDPAGLVNGLEDPIRTEVVVMLETLVERGCALDKVEVPMLFCVRTSSLRGMSISRIGLPEEK